jgi:hypothetical protein
MLNWEDAKKYLDHIRIRYTEIGAAGLLGLYVAIDPLLVRYEKGERTQELYDAIMSLE